MSDPAPQAEPAPPFPPPDFVRRGPPVDVRDLDRVRLEKWSRVVAVSPQPAGTGYEFVQKGPFTLPLAVRNEAVDAGSKDAWTFFLHPYSVFPEDAAYYNVPGQGCLESRLVLRRDDGVMLFDEVGAGLRVSGAEMVLGDLPGALGVLRKRALGDGRQEVALPWAPDVVEFDLALLDVFRLSTLLLQTRSPQEVVRELDALLARPSVQGFAWDLFDEEDRNALAGILHGEGDQEQLLQRFRVREEDFTRVSDVVDARGRQAILELLKEWEAFEAEHGARLQELALGIRQAEANLEEIKRRVHAIQDELRGKGRVSRLFSRHDQQLKGLKAEAVQQLRTMRSLEAAFHDIPGYDQLQGLSGRVQGFQDGIKTIHRLARDLFDHNVTQAQIRALRGLLREKIKSPDAATRQQGYKNYDLRLRAEIIPKVVTTHSISAYVLRRPDALPEGPSRRNVRRTNLLAARLLEYFRSVRFGERSVGEAYDETWGHVVKLEASL